ncbi:N-acyl homoserine lactonase family protein [Streptomyces sp. NPDC001663]|uniref:N-acyl homoserine lactonase family protein n=1 Tax=Streptomyces sp. NPDC001663 TaxID=3364597 RepID=UPI0036978C4E
MACDELHLLTLGYEYMPHSLLVEGETDERPIRLPLTSVLARSDGRWFLFDTGLGPDFRDPEFSRRFYHWGDPELPGPDPDPIDGQLRLCGVTLDDVDALVVSHLHADHTGGIRRFADGRPVYIQRAELEFGLNTGDASGGFIHDHYTDPGIAWHRLDGDEEIAPGIQVLASPGHTPGQLSVLMEVADGGRYLFAFDAIPTIENVERDAPLTAAAVAAQRPMIRTSQDRLIALAAKQGAELLPGACPRTWPAIPGRPVKYQ